MESQEWKDRTLKPGLEYAYPPETPDIRNMPLKDFIVNMAEKKEIVKILASNLGLGATYANEVLKMAGVEPDSLPKKDTIERVYKTLKDVMDAKVDANIAYDEEPVDVIPFKLESYGDLETKGTETFNAAVDEYFTKMRVEGKKEDSTRDQREEIRKTERVIERQGKKIEQMSEGVDKFKEMGEDIYANFQEIDALITGAKNAKKDGMNWMEYLQSKNIKVKEPAERKFDFNGIGIFIDKSVPENAEIYYEKSKTAKSKLEGAKKALKESKKRLKDLEEERVTIEKKSPGEPIAKHKPEWYEKFRWFVSSDGFLVLGGRDATTNEMLIKKHTEANDLVFHSTVHGAPFFVVKNPDNKKIPDATKRETAEAAASYSSAWGAGWGSADVYAVKPEQVSKSAESGEYLSKGAFVIRGEREWFKGTPLKIALGFKVGDYALSIGGPEGAVKSQTKYYMKVGVGNMKSGQVAKEVKANILRQTNKEDGQKIKKVIIGEIQRWIPAGKGMILK
jgi:predicted ribosome quality control (RQC) complex YloA/Tae2 family protein